MPLIDTRTVPIHYESTGNGRPVLFTAGLGGRGVYWSEQLAALKQSYRCVTWDHRAMGGSGPAEPPYSIAEWGGDAVALLDALGIETAHFVGHSTGGAIGQWLAVHHPDRFASFTLSGTWAWADARFRRVMAERKRALADRDAAAYVRESLPLLYPRDWFDRPEADLEKTERAMLAELGAPDVMAARIDALLVSDQRDGLDRIRAPVQVVSAADDCLLPAAYGEELARLIPGAALHILPDGGHHFPRTRPAAYNRLVAAFLNVAAHAEEIA